MEPVIFWLIGVALALIGGLLASYDLAGVILLHVIRLGVFVASIVLAVLAAAVKNPIVSGSALAAIIVVILLGLAAIAGAAILAHLAPIAEEKIFYVDAVILLILGLIATYPGNAYHLFSLTAC